MEVGTGLCLSRLLFTAVCEHLGTEETSCWTFGRGIVTGMAIVDPSDGPEAFNNTEL